MKNIVVLDGYTLNPGDLDWKPIEELGKITVYDRTPAEEVIKRCADAEIVITNKCVLDKEILKQLPNLKYIAVSATGYNVVDAESASEKNILISNVPGYGSSAVAQHVFALILEISNHIAANASSVDQGKWTNCPDFCYWEYSINELENKTLGIVGFGAIGQRVAKIALAFGMKVIVKDRSPEKKKTAGVEFVEIDTVFANADFITLHCPLTSENEQFVNKNMLSKMKKSASLINTGRGGLINEADLAAALKTNTIAYAGLDVLSSEPPQKDNPLIGLDNCFITPHNAWAAKEARERLLQIIAKNIKSFLDGSPQNIVN
ncbi:D-2-hydroxyacid dehydrogenase [Chondrinema litorale]|uniref:D-2-hydroxyacid dehydrogenase n=1 Tax=Chondrinema litorale TaxID=2994555 RepID=UPI0025435C19|nr:D-2-hydroxyacid dehydrogenase [Chondrinema litorale]UZR96026.1 D-2-hydroxyacid dehydrogenase [Chondrinema litorale]